MVQPIKIYVGNVPVSARNSELKELFEKFGKVVECDILKEFAFVHMEDTNDAKAAIAGLNDTLWKGSRIRVELSTTKTNKGEPSQRYKAIGDSRRHHSVDRDRDRDHRGNGSSYSASSRLHPSHLHRDVPYNDRIAPPLHRLSRNGGSSLGPIRDGRYNSSNGRSYLTDRGRPYPDAYEHRNGSRYPLHSRGGPLPPRGGYSDYDLPSPSSSSYRGSSSGDMIREHRGLPPYSDHYMRPPIHGPPPHMHHHSDYYRGPPLPSHSASMSRYDYFGPSSSSSRSSRYTPPIPASMSGSSSYSRNNYSSSLQNGALSPPPSHSSGASSSIRSHHYNGVGGSGSRDSNSAHGRRSGSRSYLSSPPPPPPPVPIQSSRHRHRSSSSHSRRRYSSPVQSRSRSRSRSSSPIQSKSSSSRHNGKSIKESITTSSRTKSSNNQSNVSTSSSSSSSSSSIKNQPNSSSSSYINNNPTSSTTNRSSRSIKSSNHHHSHQRSSKNDKENNNLSNNNNKSSSSSPIATGSSSNAASSSRRRLSSNSSRQRRSSSVSNISRSRSSDRSRQNY